MFNQCSDITEVDLSNFDSSSIKSFAAMFQGCSSLKFVNFSSLDTSSATYMGYIFYGCSSLKYLNHGLLAQGNSYSLTKFLDKKNESKIFPPFFI